MADDRIIIPNSELGYKMRELVKRIIFRRVDKISALPVLTVYPSMLSEGNIEKFLIHLAANFTAYHTALEMLGAVKKNRLLYNEITKDINENRHLDPNSEMTSREELSSHSLSKTHPIFYIDLQGNMVFVKESDMEYLRYQIQEKTIIGRRQLNPWFHRGYLREPKAKDTVKDWVRKKIKRLYEIVDEIKEGVRPPFPVPNYSRIREDRFIKRRY